MVIARRVGLWAFTVGLCASLTMTVLAQDSRGGRLSDHTQLVSTNPFGLILLPWYNAEYEHRAAENLSVIVSASRLDFGEGEAFSGVNTGLRYYPNGRLFRGFYLGPRIGLFWVSQGDWMLQEEGEMYEDGFRSLGVGLELGYAWLLGDSRHLSVSIGGGATRVLDGGAIPIVRLVNMGWAF